MVTKAEFIQYTGREPTDDDLERVNCLDAGAIGHLRCGWDYEQMKPQFDVGPRKWNGAMEAYRKAFPRSRVESN